MAHFEKIKRKRGISWRAIIDRRNVRASKTFRSKAEAEFWARERESEIDSGELVSASAERSLRAALRKYALEVSPGKRGARWEVLRLKKFESSMEDFVDRPLSEVDKSCFAEWRDRLLKPDPKAGGAMLKPNSVRREMGLVRAVISAAMHDWGWIKANPLATVRLPKSPPARKRGVSAEEAKLITDALGYVDGLPPVNMTQQVAVAFLLALETGMRAGELFGIEWDRIALDRKFLVLGKTLSGDPHAASLPKNGSAREVPLSTRAIELLNLLNPKQDGMVFSVSKATADVLFRRHRDRIGLSNLRWHDTRSGAVSRMAEKLNILELAASIGHDDLASLRYYYRAKPEEIAGKLG